MRTASAAFLAHLAGEVTTISTCWKATLANGTVYGFTDHTRDITFESVLYKSASGYIPSAVDTSSALNVDNLEVEAILNSADITEPDLMAGLWDYALVEIFWVNWNDLTMGRMILKTGTLGEVTIKRTSFLAEIRGLTQAYTNTLGELYTPTCRVAELGDARCKLDLTPYTVSGTVDRLDPRNVVIFDDARTEAGPAGGKAITGVSRAKQAVISCPAHGFSIGEPITISGVVGVTQDGAVGAEGVYFPGSRVSINGSILAVVSATAGTFTVNLDTRLYNADPLVGQTDASLVYSAYASGGIATPPGTSGTFDYGKVTFTSGFNDGLSAEVKNYVPGAIILQLPMPYLIDEGDTYTLVQGCDRAFTTCKGKFNNVPNFRGEPHLPGQDKIMQFGGMH